MMAIQSGSTPSSKFWYSGIMYFNLEFRREGPGIQRLSIISMSKLAVMIVVVGLLNELLIINSYDDFVKT